jgi:hypothetical protein
MPKLAKHIVFNAIIFIVAVVALANFPLSFSLEDAPVFALACTVSIALLALVAFVNYKIAAAKTAAEEPESRDALAENLADIRGSLTSFLATLADLALSQIKRADSSLGRLNQILSDASVSAMPLGLAEDAESAKSDIRKNSNYIKRKLIIAENEDENLRGAGIGRGLPLEEYGALLPRIKKNASKEIVESILNTLKQNENILETLDNFLAEAVKSEDESGSARTLKLAIQAMKDMHKDNESFLKNNSEEHP